jgi:STE24 endopeptidase
MAASERTVLWAVLGAIGVLVVAIWVVMGMARGPLPPEIAKHFTPQDVAQGRAYMDGRYRLLAAGFTLRLLLLLLLILTPLSAALRAAAVRVTPAHPALAVALYIAWLAILVEVCLLPLGFYSGFIREHAFGLSTQSAGSWLLDRLKSLVLSLVLLVPAGSVLALFWRRYPGRWVAPAWILASVVLVAVVALAPVVVDPLFNTVKPVQDPALRQRVLALAARAGLPVQQVFEIDASRRTRKGNAYFTGLGSTKRIVLYDTLVESNDPAAVELVLAHEMGHWKHAHIWKGLGLSVLAIGLALGCGARVLDWAGGRRLFHLAGPADIAALPLFLLTIFVLSLISLPVQNAVSRYFERQADWESLQLTHDPAAFIRSEVNLARSNRADLDPSRPLVWLLYSHPPTAERIRMAEEFGKNGPQPSTPGR